MKKILATIILVLSVSTMAFAQSEVQPISVIGNTDKSILRAPLGVSMVFAYQNASMGKNYNDNILTKSLNGFLMSLDMDFPIWKPIGLQVQLGYSMNFAKGTYTYGSGYYYNSVDVTKDMFNINIGAMPTFWVRMGKKASCYFITGPKMVITVLDKLTGRKYENNLLKSSKNPEGMYNCLNAAWGFGFGISYKHIGLKFMYEMELAGRMTGMSSSDPNNPRFNYLTVGLYIPVYLNFGD